MASGVGLWHVCLCYVQIQLVKNCTSFILLYVFLDNSSTTLDAMSSFKLWISLGFVTSCYVIFSVSMVQAMEIFMIT